MRNFCLAVAILDLGDVTDHVGPAGDCAWPHADWAYPAASRSAGLGGQVVCAGRQREPEPAVPVGSHGLGGRGAGGGDVAGHERPDTGVGAADLDQQAGHGAVWFAAVRAGRAAAGSVRLPARPRSVRGLVSW